jgi:hypothetical protein
VAVEDMAVGAGAERVAVEAPGREAEVGMVAPAGPLAPAVDTVGRAAARAPGIRAAVTTATRTTTSRDKLFRNFRRLRQRTSK